MDDPGQLQVSPLSDQSMHGLMRIIHLYDFILNWMEQLRQGAMGGESCDDANCRYIIPLSGVETFRQNRYLPMRELIMLREKLRNWIVDLISVGGERDEVYWYLHVRSVHIASRDELKPSTVLLLQELADEKRWSVDEYVRWLANQAEKKRKRADRKRGQK